MSALVELAERVEAATSDSLLAAFLAEMEVAGIYDHTSFLAALRARAQHEGDDNG